MITRKAFLKWTMLTLVCGGQSFFWGGIITNWTLVPMLLGMLTLIFMFASIESHPRYGRACDRNPILAKSLKLGIRLRWVYALLYPATILLDILAPQLSKIATSYLMADIFVGLTAVSVTKSLTGVGINLGDRTTSSGTLQTATGIDAHSFAYQSSVYLTTLITGLIHTVILALICLALYGILRLFRRRSS